MAESNLDEKYNNREIIDWIDQTPSMSEIKIKKELKLFVKDYKASN